MMIKTIKHYDPDEYMRNILPVTVENKKLTTREWIFNPRPTYLSERQVQYISKCTLDDSTYEAAQLILFNIYEEDKILCKDVTALLVYSITAKCIRGLEFCVKHMHDFVTDKTLEYMEKLSVEEMPWLYEWVAKKLGYNIALECRRFDNLFRDGVECDEVKRRVDIIPQNPFS